MMCFPDSVCASLILIQLWLFWIPAHACLCRSAALTAGLWHFNYTAVSASPLHLLISAPSCSQINVSLSEAIREMFLKVQNRSFCSGHTPHEDNLSCCGCSQLSEINTRPDGESIVSWHSFCFKSEWRLFYFYSCGMSNIWYISRAELYKQLKKNATTTVYIFSDQGWKAQSYFPVS